MVVAPPYLLTFCRSMCVLFRQFTNFHRIAVTLEDGAPLCKFDGFLYRARFYDAITAEGFLDAAERAVGNDIFVMNHAAVVEKQAVAAYELVLCGDAAD